MIRLKKMMALVIAMVMVICTMNVVALAGTGDLAPDSKITITGLTEGDTVNLFQVLKWTDSTGWTINNQFTALTEDGDNKSEGVLKLIGNTKNVQLSADDLAKIATVAQGKNKIDSKKVGDNNTYEYTINENVGPGMFVALVTAGTAGTVYNPIVISADFTPDNATNTIPASSKINGTAIAKKKVITGDKVEEDITANVGDVFNYTVTTTIPVYSSAFTNQYFKVTDKLSDYLDILNNEEYKGVTYNITVKDTDTDEPVNITSYLTVDTDKHGFTINFPHNYVSKLTAAKNITITYSAKLNVPVSEILDLENVTEEENSIVIVFPNDPNDLTGKKVTALKDGTREYTFTIDGKLFGNSSWETAELVKVGVDKDGTAIEKEIKVSNGSTHAALAGAKFGVYTTKDAAENAKGEADDEGLYTNALFDGFVETNSLGLMNIPGLNAGEYWLVELDAPNGYIKDTTPHKIEIYADINEEGASVTEYYTYDKEGNVTWHEKKVEGGIPYTYKVPVLNYYTVTIDDENTSTYDMTLDGSAIKTVTPRESSTEIKNTRGVELPATGGMGTTIFYVIGTVLVLGAGVLLVTRRRMEAN